MSLTVEEGAVFGFLGPNGAGKTTTIRILTGLAHATSGHAWVGGKDVTTDGNKIAHQIGYLPEDPAFYPWMNPREFLDHVGRAFGVPLPERSARVKELIALAGLGEAARRRIGGFSRGMRQRLGLAQALFNRPKILFLDEPASALDPAGRKEVLDFIEQQRGSVRYLCPPIFWQMWSVCAIRLGSSTMASWWSPLHARHSWNNMRYPHLKWKWTTRVERGSRPGVRLCSMRHG